MAGNSGGPGTQADQPDPLGRMSELFAQVLLLLAVSSQNIITRASQHTCLRPHLHLRTESMRYDMTQYVALVRIYAGLLWG